MDVEIILGAHKSIQTQLQTSQVPAVGDVMYHDDRRWICIRRVFTMEYSRYAQKVQNNGSIGKPKVRLTRIVFALQGQLTSDDW